MTSFCDLPSTGSLTVLYHRYHAGDSDAETELFQRVFPLVLEVARRTATANCAAIASGSDFANSAWMSFHLWMRKARLKGNESSSEFWSLLVEMTKRKAREHGRWETALKRGGGKVVAASSLQGTREYDWLDTIPAAKTLDVELLDVLYKDSLDALDSHVQSVILLKLQGHTNRQIAGLQGISERSVERKLAIARRAWTELKSD